MKKTIKDITHQKDLARFFTNLNKRLKPGKPFHGKIKLGQHKASKTELIGTLFHAGFDLFTEEDKDGHFHFTLKKIALPGPLSEVKKAKRPIFQQRRVGETGKPITIWKLRTMYPMAHKAQEYL